MINIPLNEDKEGTSAFAYLTRNLYECWKSTNTSLSTLTYTGPSTAMESSMKRQTLHPSYYANTHASTKNIPSLARSLARGQKSKTNGPKNARAPRLRPPQGEGDINVPRAGDPVQPLVRWCDQVKSEPCICISGAQRRWIECVYIYRSRALIAGRGYRR